MDANNLDKLVKTVTEKILENMDRKTVSQLHKKSCMILIPNISFGFNDFMEYILANYPDYNLYLGSSEEFSKIHANEINKKINFVKYDLEASEFTNLLDTVETIIILGLKINQMKALINTDDQEAINHIIFGRLLANKSVNILINANGSILQEISEIVSDIRNMGINVTNIQQNNVSKLARVDLITESYVEKLKEKGLKVLVLDKKQLITPLAKDKLSECKIKVEYSEENK